MDIILYHGTSIDPERIKREGIRIVTAAQLRTYLQEFYGIILPPIPTALLPYQHIYLTNSEKHARQIAFMGGWTVGQVLLSAAVGRRRPGYVYTVKIPSEWLGEGTVQALEERGETFYDIRIDIPIPPERVIAVKRVR